MSLYNALFGMNHATPILKAMLGLDGSGPPFPENWSPYEQGYTDEGRKYVHDCIAAKCWPTGRFRDIHLSTGDERSLDRGPRIVLFTRNGGGNRESYFYVFDILRAHPNYLRDYDDDFDSTYASIEFSIPEKFRDAVAIMLDSSATYEGKPMDRFSELIQKLQGSTGENDPDVQRAVEVGKDIFGKMEQKFKEGGGVIEV